MSFNLNSGYGSSVAAMLVGTTTGKTFYVAPSTLSNLSDLQDLFTFDQDGVQRTFTSLTSALSNVVAGRGDVILVAPGYTETVATASGLTISKSGVTIRGIGNGALRPTITVNGVIGASILVSGANVTIDNVNIVAGLDALTAMINVTGADVAFTNCDITTNTATLGVVLGILTAATATNFRVEGCRFIGAATNSGTTTTAQIQHEVGTDYVIRNNYFTGKMTQAILNATTVLRGLIDNNRFVVATGTKAIAMAAASTPFITNNRINVPSGTAPIVAAAGFVAGNVYSAAAWVTAGTASTI